MCPCGVVNSIKVLVRAESPRDFTDIMLSWKHLPNITICDFARGLSTHANLRNPNMIPFIPHEGRLLEPNDAIIAATEEGRPKMSDVNYMRSFKFINIESTKTLITNQQ